MRPLHVTHPLAKTDDGPQGAAETAATAEASADQPLNINRQRLLQHAVDTRQGRPELLGGHSGHQSTRELCVEFIAKAKAGRGGEEEHQWRSCECWFVYLEYLHGHIARSLNDDGIWNESQIVDTDRAITLIILLVLVDRIKVSRHPLCRPLWCLSLSNLFLAGCWWMDGLRWLVFNSLGSEGKLLLL